MMYFDYCIVPIVEMESDERDTHILQRVRQQLPERFKDNEWRVSKVVEFGLCKPKRTQRIVSVLLTDDHIA